MKVQKGRCYYINKKNEEINTKKYRWKMGLFTVKPSKFKTVITRKKTGEEIKTTTDNSADGKKLVTNSSESKPTDPITHTK